MALASDSADQARMSAEEGIKMPRVTSGMNKLPPPKEANTKAAKKKAKDDADLISKAKKRFIKARTTEASNRTDALDDIKFLNGEQWSAADASARASEGRPCLTQNRLPTFANQITNDQRQNRPAISISPLGDKASKKDAKIAKGMIRAIERDSNAEVAYDTGFQSAVHNGWGYWRIAADYEGEDTFNQVLEILPISNPFNVYLDPNRTPFGLDAEFGFISEMLPKDEFEDEYPDATPTPWGEAGVGESDKEWITNDEIRVAEYYYFKREDRELVMLSNGFQGYEDDLHEDIKKMIADGTLEVEARRTVSVKKLKWCKITALEVLEEQDCDGQYIPIIECNGTVFNINGKIIRKGIVRDAKGPQRMLNYYDTLEAENVALQPKAPFIMEEGQVEGHEAKWQNANRKSFSYLLYRGTSVSGKPAPPPQRQQFAGPPQALLSAKEGQQEALKAVTGIRFDATMSERMQDESGRAIRELNRNANLGAYHYIDNFGRALKNTGIVLMDLIPYKYDTKRIVAILDDTGAEERVMIDPYMDKAHGEAVGTTPDSNQPERVKVFNPKIGRYSVTVTIGPSYATKRVEAVESQIELIKAVPQIGPMIADIIAKNSDWDGADEIATRLAKALPPNMITPAQGDMSPQVQALVSGLQQQVQQLTMQTQQLIRELSERDKDRGVIEMQINKKFEAEMVKVASTFEAKMQEIQAKTQQHMNATIGRQLAEVAKSIKSFEATNIQAQQQGAQLNQQQTLPVGPPGQNP